MAELLEDAVQTPAPPAPERLPAGCHGHPEPPPINEPMRPRRFGRARVFHLDCGITVTIRGDENTLESECWPVFEGNELHVYTGDAAIERRIAKQQGAVSEITVPSSHRSQSAISPRVDDAMALLNDEQRARYEAHRANRDPEQQAFADLGLDDVDVVAMKRGTTIGAQLAAVAEEEIA